MNVSWNKMFGRLIKDYVKKMPPPTCMAYERSYLNEMDSVWVPQIFVIYTSEEVN